MNPILNCTVDQAQMKLLAEKMYDYAKAENVKLFFLKGQMGSGKTTFCQYFIKYKDQELNILSPTYAYMHEYFVNNHYIWHFDLYRVNAENSLTDLGILDYLHRDDGIALIEWPELLGNFYQSYKIMTINFHHIEDQNKRTIMLTTNY